MNHSTKMLRSPVSRGGLALVCAFLAGATLYLPSALQAQQRGARLQGSGTVSAGSGTAAKAAAPSPADSAACVQVIGYAFQHPEVIQKGEQLRAAGKTKQLSALPDSVRAKIAAAVAKGQNDSLKAMARAVDPKAGNSFDDLIDFVTAFPDSVRTAVATLVASGRPMTCSPE